MTTINEVAERQDFEQRYQLGEASKEQDDIGDYLNIHVQFAWQGWQARATLQQASGEALARKPVEQENARFAIEAAISFGLHGINKPPSDDHWLMDFWRTGERIAKLESTQRAELSPSKHHLACDRKFPSLCKACIAEAEPAPEIQASHGAVAPAIPRTSADTDRSLFHSFKFWAGEHLGQGYGLELEEGSFTDPVTRWAFVAYKAGIRRGAINGATASADSAADARDAARWRYVRDTETLETAVWEALEGIGLAPDGVLDQAAYAAGMDAAVDWAIAAIQAKEA